MFECPNCKEALGDDIRICPFCRHEETWEPSVSGAEKVYVNRIFVVTPA